ncbi:MAG: hypothetical protein ACM3L9_09540, partial [Deltaproteobacteria bacterium]
LPVFADARNDAALLARRFSAMAGATTFAAACYLVTAMLAGGYMLQIAFGANYAGLQGVMAWLAAMWAIRMLQAVPGMVLLAAGETRPFLAAGTIRAVAALPAAFLAAGGFGIEAVAAMGFCGELASLAYIAWRMDRQAPGLSALFLSRAVMLVPAAAMAGIVLLATADSALIPRAIAVVLALGGGAVIAALPMSDELSQLRKDVRA